MFCLDGNSLGALPRRALTIAQRVLQEEWRSGLIRSWNDAAWFSLPRRLGDKIAQLIGAQVGEVVVADSTSVNLFKVLNAAVQLRKGRIVDVQWRSQETPVLPLAEAAGDRIEERLVRGRVPERPAGDIQP